VRSLILIGEYKSVRSGWASWGWLAGGDLPAPRMSKSGPQVLAGLRRFLSFVPTFSQTTLRDLHS
jgi:hypothetical protein